MIEAYQRATPNTGLSTTAIAAIATGIGISVILIIALIVLLVRAIQTHRRLLADLEGRGVSTTQARGDAQNSVARPRSVLRRNTVLPYNNSGWGTLTSVETIKSAETSGTVDHYVPPKPTDAMKKGGRLSWPFHTRRVSGHNIHLKKVKGSRLSTVLEDPKPSAMVPVLGSSFHNTNRPILLSSQPHESRHSSSQSLLQHHPAIRNSAHESDAAKQDRSASSNSYFRAGANDRLQRAKSFADVPSEQPERPQLRARSASVCGHVSGNAPDVLLPPLPLDIARIKNETRRQSPLRRIPSKQSDSSLASVDTSILANHASPIIALPVKRRPQKITKPRTRGSGSVGTRPFRDSLDLRAKVLGLRLTPTTSPARPNTAPSEMGDLWIESQSQSSQAPHAQDLGTARRTKSVPTNSVSPSKDESPTTPKRKLKSQLYSEGSPERQRRTQGRGYNGVIRSPKRQHSQASSRSSGGNPFQWDPTPLSGKPSALKGSPSARQGHRRKNSVRISLVPTFHGPPTRTPSPSFMVETKEDATEGGALDSSAAGLGFAMPDPGPRALPTPPSSSTFAPELNFPTASLHPSLTQTSPTLSLAGYDQNYVVFPTDRVLQELSKLEGDRTSSGSAISLSKFPGAPSVGECVDDTSCRLRTRSSDLYDFSRDYPMPETPFLPQTPFGSENVELEQPFSSSGVASRDTFDPEQTSIVFQTPTNTSSRPWQSNFATIPEESSVSSQRTVDMSTPRQEDSPPISPKTMSPPRFSPSYRTAYDVPVYATAIPEETPDTIDPAFLSKDAFVVLDSRIKSVDNTILDVTKGSPLDLALVIPRTGDLAQTMFDPLRDAAFPHSPVPGNGKESPILGHGQSEASSIYTLPSPMESLSPTSSPIELPSPMMPCSPRPPHAQLPNATPSLSINFTSVPKLSPSAQGPRRSPPRPLPTAIAALRRMNSDAANAEKEKSSRGERRYLGLGREKSIATPGDESWLDEMDDSTSIEYDDSQGCRQVAGACLDEWDDGCTVLNVEEGSTVLSTSTITPETEVTMGQEDSCAGAEETDADDHDYDHASSIWEDGEAFWASSTPPRPTCPDNPLGEYIAASGSITKCPSPSVSPIHTYSIAPPSPSPLKKRMFQVSRDSSQSQSQSPTPRSKRAQNPQHFKGTGNGYMERSALAQGTSNVRIQVTSPSGRIVAGEGGLYDSQGFLRY